MWAWIAKNGADRFALSFDESERLAGLPLDPSFLTYKKELSNDDCEAGKISLKTQTVYFIRKKEG